MLSTKTLIPKDYADICLAGYQKLCDENIFYKRLPVDVVYLGRMAGYSFQEFSDKRLNAGLYSRTRGEVITNSIGLTKHRKRWLAARGLGFLMMEELEIAQTGKLTPEIEDKWSGLKSDKNDDLNRFAAHLLIPQTYLDKNKEASVWKIAADCGAPAELVDYRLNNLTV